jgi:hypothetical protein
MEGRPFNVLSSSASVINKLAHIDGPLGGNRTNLYTSSEDDPTQIRSVTQNDPIPKNNKPTTFLHIRQLTMPQTSSFSHRRSLCSRALTSMTQPQAQNGHSSQPSSPAASSSRFCLRRSHRDICFSGRNRASSEAGKGSVHPDWCMHLISALWDPSRFEA